MREDLVYMKGAGCFYSDWLERVRPFLLTVDVTDRFLAASNLDRLFQRWHYNTTGNRLVADALYEALMPVFKDRTWHAFQSKK